MLARTITAGLERRKPPTILVARRPTFLPTRAPLNTKPPQASRRSARGGRGQQAGGTNGGHVEQVRADGGAQARTTGPRDAAEEHHRRHARPCRGAARGRARHAASRSVHHPARPFRQRRRPRRSTAKQEADIRERIAGNDERFADLDAMGVDMQLVCPPPPQFYYTVPLDIAVQATRMVNDGIAEYRRQAPGPLVALGGVPLPTATRRPRNSSAA